MILGARLEPRFHRSWHIAAQAYFVANALKTRNIDRCRGRATRIVEETALEAGNVVPASEDPIIHSMDLSSRIGRRIGSAESALHTGYEPLPRKARYTSRTVLLS